MGGIAWREIKDLIVRPAEVFEGILARHQLPLSLSLGTLSYYVHTLQISELLLPRRVGGSGYLLLNLPIALGRMLLTVCLIHLAAGIVARGVGRWRDLLTLWGYVQLPHIGLTILAVVLFATTPRATNMDEDILRIGLLGGIVLALFLWGLILKLQALKTCYQIHGGRLLAVIVGALVLIGIVGGLEGKFLYERGFVSQPSLTAMGPRTITDAIGRKNLVLPFDTLTYHLRDPAPGEIVGFIFQGQGEWRRWITDWRRRSVGRIVGVAGDAVEVRHGQLFINGQADSEPYRHGAMATGLDLSLTIVPSGHVFILGDHRAIPLDSYGGGVVPRRAVRGRLTDIGRLKWRLVVGTWLW
jgi:signal peptidase I